MSLRDLIEKQRAENAAKTQAQPAAKPEESPPAKQQEMGPEPGKKLTALERVKLNLKKQKELEAKAQAARIADGLEKPAEKKATNSGAKPTPARDETFVDPSIAPVYDTPPPAKAQTQFADFDEFRRDLDFLAANIEEKELVQQVVRKIAVQLKSNPQFATNMANKDFDLIVRGLRRGYAIAARGKTEKKTARTKEAKDADELAKELSDLGVDLDF